MSKASTLEGIRERTVIDGTHVVWTGVLCGKQPDGTGGIPTYRSKNVRVTVWNATHPDDQVTSGLELRMTCTKPLCVAAEHIAKRSAHTYPQGHKTPHCCDCGCELDIPTYLAGTPVRCSDCSEAAGGAVEPNSEASMAIAARVASGEFDKPMQTEGKRLNASQAANGRRPAETAVTAVEDPHAIEDLIGESRVAEDPTPEAPEPDEDQRPTAPLCIAFFEAATRAMLERFGQEKVFALFYACGALFEVHKALNVADEAEVSNAQ